MCARTDFHTLNITTFNLIVNRMFFDIVNDGEIIDLTSEQKSICNQVIRGGVKIQKRDLETKVLIVFTTCPFV